MEIRGKLEKKKLTVDIVDDEEERVPRPRPRLPETTRARRRNKRPAAKIARNAHTHASHYFLLLLYFGFFLFYILFFLFYILVMKKEKKKIHILYISILNTKES